MGDFDKKPTRTEYCHREDVSIVKYLRDKDAWHLTKGNLIWQKMERAKICPNRSFQSLRNRFLRNIEKRLKCDFRHILNQEPKRRHRLNSSDELNKNSDQSFLNKSGTGRKIVESPTYGGHYDKPEFETIPESFDLELSNNENPIQNKIIKSPASSQGQNKNNPVVVLQRLVNNEIKNQNDDGWLYADHQEEAAPKRKRLCSDQANNIILDDESENSESIYFSVACLKNKVGLDSQKKITSNDNSNREHTPATKPTTQNEINNILNRKSFTKNWTVTNNVSKDNEVVKEKEVCDTDDVNQKCTQEVIDLTEASEVVRVAIDNQSQSSTPSNVQLNSSSQTDLFAPNMENRYSEERIRPSSPKSDSFLSSIKTRGQVELKKSHLSKSQNFETSIFPNFNYLALVPNSNSHAAPETSIRLSGKNRDNTQNVSPEASQYLTANEKSDEHELSVKMTEKFNIYPNSSRGASFKIKSRIKQCTLLSRRILQLHQMIRSAGLTQSKRNQRQLYSLARYILNLKGRKTKKNKAILNKDVEWEKPRQRATSTQVIDKPPPSTSSTQVSTRKSPRAIQKINYSLQGSSLQKTNTRDKPERRSILLENMLSCLEFEKRKQIRKTIID